MTGQFDVIAVAIDGGTVRVLARDKTWENAEAIVSMAVMRRGVDEEFFVSVASNTYRDGDQWRTA